SIFDFAKVGCSSSTTYFCKIKKGWLVIEKYFREKLELPFRSFIPLLQFFELLALSELFLQKSSFCEGGRRTLSTEDCAHAAQAPDIVWTEKLRFSPCCLF
ncbi:MAG: hypothetical protein SNG38_09240, partial [Rikenellaceae bacterium]